MFDEIRGHGRGEIAGYVSTVSAEFGLASGQSGPWMRLATSRGIEFTPDTIDQDLCLVKREARRIGLEESVKPFSHHQLPPLCPGHEVGPALHQPSVDLSSFLLVPVLRPLLKSFPNNLAKDQSRCSLVLSGHLIDRFIRSAFPIRARRHP